MAKHRSYSIEFKRQVAKHCGLAKRHDISRKRPAPSTATWLPPTSCRRREARIAALERLVGKLALENEFLTSF